MLLMIKALWQDSKSSASPFCEYQGLNTFTPLMVMCSQESGCRHQLGEFLKVTPSSNTFLLFTMFSSTGRSQGRISFHSSSVSMPSGLLKFLHARAPFSEPAVGYQTEFSTTPPDFTSASHCAEVSLPFFTGRQLSPEPSNTPWPVMAMFSAFMA